MRQVLLRLAAMSAVAACAAVPAQALDVLGLYVGGAIGQGQVQATAPSLNASDFKENHSAFKVVAGLRPISLFGVEAAYLDFGRPAGALGALNANVSLKGAAAYGLFYLPLPLPILDVYVKGGLARLDSTVKVSSSLFALDRTNTSFTAGAGLQLKLGDWAVRGEYERFSAAGGTPGLLTVGVTWTLL